MHSAPIVDPGDYFLVIRARNQQTIVHEKQITHWLCVVSNDTLRLEGDQIPRAYGHIIRTSQQNEIIDGHTSD